MSVEKIGRYEVQSTLGRGGMATVYEAYDPTFGRNVAVKVLPREFLHDPQFRSRFEREAKTIAALEHLGIVPVYDFGEDNGQPFLVMRLMGGGSLGERLRESPLSLEETVAIMARIGAALGAAHGKGIIHRDLKPGNILFDADGNPFIADFGIVKLAEHTSMLTGSGVVGTPAYMAPEMTSKGGVTGLVDIYAMGVCLYQMLTGELPFDADTPMGIIGAHLAKPVPNVLEKRPDLPEQIQYVVERAMAKDPAERYQSMSDMVDDLQAAAGGQLDPSTLVALSPPQPAAPTGRRATPTRATVTRPAGAGTARPGLRPVWIAGAAVAALALAAGGLFVSGVLPLSPPSTPTQTATTEEVVVETSPTTETVIPTMQTFGPVEVMVPGGGTFEVVAGNRPLDVGDTIRVGEDGVALLTFAAGVSAELHPGATLVIDRLEVSGDTLAIELTQSAGTSYHFLIPDLGGLRRDYTVHTPLGTAHAVGTRFWTSQRDNGWLFAPADGSITLEVGADDENEADNYTAEAANEDCLLVDPAENVTGCDVEEEGLTPLTDGATVAPLSTPTPTAQFFAAPGVATTPPPTDEPTRTVPPPSPTAVTGGGGGPVCGNGSCEGGENSSNCPADCGPPPPTCPNGSCGGGETCTSCPQDCGTCPPVCGNGPCESGESTANCWQDCGSACGDSTCNGTETRCSCALDCGTPACNQWYGTNTGTPCAGGTIWTNCFSRDECGNVCWTGGTVCGSTCGWP